MNPNEVRLIDFDMDTLSMVNDSVIYKSAQIKEQIDSHGESWKYRKQYQEDLQKLLTFRTQVLYAFSLVKSNESVTHN